ncbi:MAG TPA: ABC transporter permease, partial [Burkholderiales bacterium]|nr:ABC transporter permease [Burkholderiales bacterium]
MRIPIAYSIRNLWARKLTTVLTAGGMALVVFVYAAVLMLDAGLRAALVATGQPDNILMTRRASSTEVQSSIDRTQAAIIETTPGVAIGADLRPMVSKETVVLITLPKSESGVLTNITTRGIGPAGLVVRPQIEITQGRMLNFGTSEI